MSLTLIIYLQHEYFYCGRIQGFPFRGNIYQSSVGSFTLLFIFVCAVYPWNQDFITEWIRSVIESLLAHCLYTAASLTRKRMTIVFSADCRDNRYVSTNGDLSAGKEFEKKTRNIVTLTHSGEKITCFIRFSNHPFRQLKPILLNWKKSARKWAKNVTKSIEDQSDFRHWRVFESTEPKPIDPVSLFETV